MSEISRNDVPWYGKSYNTDKLIEKILPGGELLSKSYDPGGFFKKMVTNIKDKPFWVKQAIFLELRDDIRRMTSVELLEAIDKNDLLQLYVPMISVLGKKILMGEHSELMSGITVDHINFLKSIDGEKNVIDLCYANNITLKRFSEIIILTEEKGFTEQIRSNQIFNVFKYLANDIEIGDLLLKLNKITPDQLSFASFTLAESQKAFDGEDGTTFEDVLIRLNYVTKDQLNSLLVLKKASEIPFEPITPACSEEIELMQENLDILVSEKQDLQKQLDTVKPLLDAKDRKIKELEEELQKYKTELDKCQGSQGKPGWLNKV